MWLFFTRRLRMWLILTVLVPFATGVLRKVGRRLERRNGPLTVSRTLLEELKWDRSNVTSLDWESYPILTFPQVPEIVMELIDRPTEKPWGAGEPTAAVVSSAIANAIFDATGVRLRSVPFTPEKVKGAWRGAT